MNESVIFIVMARTPKQVRMLLNVDEFVELAPK